MPPISTAERVLRFFGLPLVRMIYHVTTIGLERLPRGGFLLLPNHITWVDGIILAIACPRPIRFMVAEEYYRIPWLHWVLKTTRTIPITPRRSKAAMQVAAEAIRAGEIVCVFPEGELSRTGSWAVCGAATKTSRSGPMRRSCRSCSTSFGARSFPSRAGASFANGRGNFPIRRRSSLVQPLAPDEADIATVREKLLQLGEGCFSRRRALRLVVRRGRAARSGAPSLSDRGDGWNGWLVAQPRANCSARPPPSAGICGGFARSGGSRLFCRRARAEWWRIWRSSSRARCRWD